MNTTFANRKIKALAGTAMPECGDEYDVVAHVIDCILENEDCNGPGTFAGWEAGPAIDTFATDTWFLNHGSSPADIDWDAVIAAVEEALRMLVELDRPERRRADL